jgi:DNA-binding transcriptional ArsR family regulator
MFHPQHLRVLKDARLVLDEPVGTQRIYRLNPSGIHEIRAYFDRFWDDALESFEPESINQRAGLMS